MKHRFFRFILQIVITFLFSTGLSCFFPDCSLAAAGDEAPAIPYQVHMLWGVAAVGAMLVFLLLRHYFNRKKNRANGLGLTGDTPSVQLIDGFIQSQTRKMDALHAIGLAMANVKEAWLNPHVMAEEIVRHLDVDAAIILLLRPADNTLEYAAGYGLHTDQMKKSRVKVGEGLAGRAALERQVVFVRNVTEAGEPFTRSHLTGEEDFISYAGVPLTAGGQVQGVLEVFFRRPFYPDNKWFRFLETLAGFVSVSLENALLAKEVQQSRVYLEKACDATVEGWSRAMELSGKESGSHIRNVSAMTMRLAREIGIGANEIEHIRRGTVLHDIGMLGVPNHILLKPERLTEREWEIMRKHPQFAHDVLSAIDYLRPALDIPYCHHEKWDGSGYPRGLKETQIPIAARIFSVVDVWDALRSERPYRASWPDEMVWEHIRSQSGESFDPKVVDAFLRLVGAREQYQLEMNRTSPADRG
jgi:HD-GYP domain-containing protein (c-di-GMP phosphodiesterase class II)